MKEVSSRTILDMRWSDADRLMRVREQAASGEARRLRERARFSLKEMGSMIGTSSQNLSRWELGVTTPRYEQGLRWARILERLAAVPPPSGDEHRAETVAP